MATALIKGAIAIGALGATAGTGVAIYLNIGNTIEDSLISDRLILISNDNDYKFHLFEHKENQKLKDAIGKSKIDHSQNISDLKSWCKNNLKKRIGKGDSVFENAKVWCVVPKIKTLGDKVKGTVYGDGEWQGKYVEFFKKTSETKFVDALKVDFTSVEFSESTSDGGAKLKAWCEKVIKTNTYDATEHKSEKNLKNWCIKVVSS